jgi:hypothetical protein
MPPVGLEPTIPARETPQTDAADRRRRPRGQWDRLSFLSTVLKLSITVTFGDIFKYCEIGAGRM